MISDELREIITNPEIAECRSIVDGRAGAGRVLTHAIVHPNVPGDLEAMIGQVPGDLAPELLVVFNQEDAISHGFTLPDRSCDCLERTTRRFSGNSSRASEVRKTCPVHRHVPGLNRSGEQRCDSGF